MHVSIFILNLYIHVHCTLSSVPPPKLMIPATLINIAHRQTPNKRRNLVDESVKAISIPVLHSTIDDTYRDKIRDVLYP